QTVWRGYIELCRYFYNPDKSFVPAALGLEQFKGVSTETLVSLCMLPDEIPTIVENFSYGHGPVFPHQKGTPVLETSSYTGSLEIANIQNVKATFSNREKDYDQAARLRGVVYLPASAFKDKAIRRENPTSDDFISSLFHSVCPDGAPPD